MPLHALVQVEQATYAEQYHARMLDALDLGHHVTQLTLQILLKQRDGETLYEPEPRSCELWLDEEAMRILAADGVAQIVALQGRHLVLVNDYPDDAAHPLRLYNLL